MINSSLLTLLLLIPTAIMAMLGMIPYMGLLVVTMVIVIGANIFVKSTANKNMNVACKHNMTGLQVAQLLLDKANLRDVSIVEAGSMLGEYYDPARKVVAISRELGNSTSVTSTAVVAHEIGHAIQHHTKSYLPMKIRAFLIGLSRFVQVGSIVVFMASIFLGGTMYIDYLIGAVTLSLCIQIVTLPVEINASIRALKLLEDTGLITDSDEKKKATKVLKAAAYTYVAGLLSTILQLVRLLLIRGDRD